MKQTFGVIFAVMIAAIVASVAVSATTTTLSSDSLTMGYTDVQVVQACFSGYHGNTVSVVINPICKDVDGVFGCQAGDTLNPSGFSVVPGAASVADGGCTNLTITTTLTPSNAGTFYYTVNGEVGQAVLGSETGQVFVPEFGVAAAGLVLVGAGLFISKRR